jgi:glycerate kinase
MRVLVSPDCFTGTLTSVEAANAIRDGWLQIHPDDEVVIAPLSDGGPGFVGGCPSATTIFYKYLFSYLTDFAPDSFYVKPM